MRISNRRFTPFTNAFSKKLENHGHMVAPHFMHYNFARVHKTLRITPANGGWNHRSRWVIGRDNTGQYRSCSDKAWPPIMARIIPKLKRRGKGWTAPPSTAPNAKLALAGKAGAWRGATGSERR